MKDGSLVSQVKDLQYFISMGAAGRGILRQKEEMEDATQAHGMAQPPVQSGSQLSSPICSPSHTCSEACLLDHSGSCQVGRQ